MVESDLAGVRVLLAEDNATNQVVASEMLKTLGAEVVLAADGKEALALFEAQPFDLALLDIEMPRLSGLDVIKAIRATGDARAKTCIVALTAYVLPEHRERILRAGADGIVAKPLRSISDLGASLSQFINTANATVKDADGDTASNSVALLDQSVLRALRDALGADTLRDLLGKVLVDLESVRAILDAPNKPVDVNTLRARSHILMSVAGTIGATRLQHAAQTLNTAAHAAEASGASAASLVSQTCFVLTEIDRLASHLRRGIDVSA
ncbi:MAG: response regulator [Pseudomonadota bacterium]